MTYKKITIYSDLHLHFPVMTDEGLISEFTYCGAPIGEDDLVSIQPVTCPKCKSLVSAWSFVIGIQEGEVIV